VDQSSNKKCLVVVSDDKDIKFYVRPLGAKVVGVQEFWSKVKGPLRKRMRGQETDRLPLVSQYQITKELEKFWLDNPKKHTT